jgi:hypothetical protein
MKRKIFSIMAIAAIALVSCKKDDLNSTELGEATISGNLWADLDLTNTAVEGVNGMQVKVEINTMDWDQQPVAGFNYDKKVYTTTTNSSGDYTLTLPATDEGYTITIEFEDMYTTRTTTNGTENVEITRNDINMFIYSGAVLATQDQATVNVLNNDPQANDWINIYGTVYVDYDVANWNAAPPANQRLTTASGLGAQDIVWRYESAPYGASDMTVYTMAVDLTDGSYWLTIPSESVSGNSVGMDWGMMDFLGSRIQNNMAGTADSSVAGYYSAGGQGIEYYDGWYYNGGDIVTNLNIFLNFNSF